MDATRVAVDTLAQVAVGGDPLLVVLLGRCVLAMCRPGFSSSMWMLPN